MFDESTNTSSSCDFLKLREECSRLVRFHADKVTHSLYPEIHTLANEYRSYIDNVKIENIAKSYYDRNDKISLIKLIREKYSMSLLEAKVFADGFWERYKNNVFKF